MKKKKHRHSLGNQAGVRTDCASTKLDLLETLPVENRGQN